MDYSIFIEKWIKRSERKIESDFIDIGDCFISLWIAFNALLKSQYGESLTDRKLIEKIILDERIIKVFNEVKEKNISAQKALEVLGQYDILDMRDPHNVAKKINYDGSFKSLIEGLYQIRCNLFHGRKDVDEDTKDIELVGTAYAVLLPILKDYLSL